MRPAPRPDDPAFFPGIAYLDAVLAQLARLARRARQARVVPVVVPRPILQHVIRVEQGTVPPIRDELAVLRPARQEHQLRNAERYGVDLLHRLVDLERDDAADRAELARCD